MAIDIQVNLTPEQINTLVAETILKSAIGDALIKVIDREVKKLGESYNNPFEPIVREHIRSAIIGIIQEKYLDIIKTQVAKNVSEEIITNLFTKMWDTFINKY